jgi:hypothetical protein
MQGFRDILLAASAIVQSNEDDRTKLSALGLMASIYDRILSTDLNSPTISAAVNKAKAIETSRLTFEEMEMENIQEQVEEEEASELEEEDD